MTIGLVLTIIFLLLQFVFHAIAWPIWALFLPLIIEGGLELLILIIVGLGFAFGTKTVRKHL